MTRRTLARLVPKLTGAPNMITSATLKILCSFTAPELTTAINIAGHKGDMFESAEFVGMTNGGQFAYKVTIHEDGKEQNAKVFLSYDQAEDKILANY